MAQSANNAYLMWRQFSGGMQKLAGTTGTVATQGAVSAPQAKSEWQKQIMGLAKGAQEVVDLYRDDSFKQAEQYMKSHSIEEYRKAAQEDNLPFKDDPIAMARLKNLHGGIASSMALQDFLDRVSDNEFVGKTPQEVDSAFYKHMNESFKELGDSFPYAGGGDHAYDSGFWQNGNKARSLVLNKFNDVENDWTNKQAQIATQAQLSNVIETPDISSGQIRGYFYTQGQLGAFQSSPDALYKSAVFTMQKLGGQANGYKLLNELYDQQIPNAPKGITFGSLIGDDERKQLIAHSFAVVDRNNYKGRIDFENHIGDLIRDRDELSVNSLIDAELQVSKGQETPRLDILNKAKQQIVEAKHQEALQAVRQQQKDAQKLNQNTLAYQRLIAMKNGQSVKPLAELGVPNEANLQAFTSLKEAGNLSIADVMSIAKNPSMNNPARDEIQRLTEDSVSEVASDVKLVRSGEKITGELQVPKGTEALIEAYESDPSAFMTINGNVANRNFNYIMGLKMALEAGIPYRQVVTGMADFEELPMADRMKLAHRIGALQGIDRGNTSSPIKGAYAETYVNVMARNAIRAGMGADAAYSKAKEMFNNTHINVAGTAVPTSFFSSLKGLSPTIGADALDEHMVALLKKNSLEEKDVSARYDLGTNSILVQNNKDGTLIDNITVGDLQVKYNKYLKKTKADQEAMIKQKDSEAYQAKISSALVNSNSITGNLSEGYRDIKAMVGRGAKFLAKGAEQYQELQEKQRPDHIIGGLLDKLK